MSAIYESEKLLAEYLLFHFGSADEILTPGKTWPPGMQEALDFPVRTVSHFSPSHGHRGLDLGCAVGRSSFEMARTCDEVIGIDFSHAFIDAAITLSQGNPICYRCLEEATIHSYRTATAPAGVDGKKLRFRHGDAMHLPDDLGRFDRVHAANLLCRLPSPNLLLERLPALVVPGGELVLATPCTWLQEFTPAENWPLGRTFDWLLERLSPDFELIKQTEEPFLIRETARKFQWTQSMLTVWRRIGNG